MSSDILFSGIQTLSEEPWVKLANGDELANWGRNEEIAYNQANRIALKYAFYVQAFDFLYANKIKGDYHEYGCHRVRTFRMALTEARRRNLDDVKFFAFDSFEGLPNTEVNPTTDTIWEKGLLSTSDDEFLQIIQDHGIYVDKCVTVKGFYNESLTKDLQRKFLNEEAKIALACIDCTFYESAVSVFDFIGPLLQEGSLLYLDDMFSGYNGSPVKGVGKAFREFQEKSQFKFIPHIQVGWWGRSFIAYLDDRI